MDVFINLCGMFIWENTAESGIKFSACDILYEMT